MPTLNQLINLTLRSRRQNAAFVHVIGMRRQRRRDGIGSQLITLTIENGARRHTQTVQAVRPNWTGPLSDRNTGGLIISCNCGDWIFRFEWVMVQLGAAHVIHGNGEPPTINNPNHTPSLCKHLYVDLLYIRKNGY